MARDLIDAFLDGLRDVATQFTTNFVAERMGTTPRSRKPSVKVKPPKTPKVPKQPKARKESGPTLYDELEVSRRASAETIRAAYLSLSKRFHPDVAKFPNAAARMKRINAANDILSNPEKRKAYDRSLRG